MLTKLMSLYYNSKRLMSVRKDSLNSSHAYRLCCKHPEKVATHQLLSKNASPDAFYCEKCSIMLASQGYNVMKLTSVPNIMVKKDSMSSRNSKSSSCRQVAMPSNRKSQICSFTQSLNSIHQQLSQKLCHVHDHLIRSENLHGRIIEEANKFYKQLEEIIELQKYTTYNNILTRRYAQENRIRQIRENMAQAYDDVEAIMEDIRDNMDAVETVDYSIYNTIMGGYMVKLEGINKVAKSVLPIKQIQPYELVLPEIPKFILSLASKIEIIQKKQTASMPNSVHNSFNTSSYKPPRIITEDDEVVCISERSSNQEDRPYNHFTQTKIGSCKETSRQQEVDRSQYQYEYYEEQSSSVEAKHKEKEINNEACKENKGDHMNNSKKVEEDVVIKQIIRSRNQFPEMAFSFDEQSHNEKQLRLREREDSNLMEGSNLLTMRGFEDGKLSKIQERFNNKEVCESRQSLGEYLGIQHSREGAHFLQDTETLLIA